MKIKTPKREVKSFRNKYLALTIISLLFFATSQAQWIKPNNAYGTISNGQSIERVLLFPTGCGTPNKLNISDSAVNKFAIYGDSCGNVAYLYNPRTKIWSPISNGGIIQDGLISGGIVTWSGSGLKFYVTPAVYVIGGKFYNSPFDSVTLATAPTSDSRIDLIGVDTTSHAFATTGTPSTTPIVPQADISSQIALTTGILLNANDTVPSNVITSTVYSEHTIPPEWATGTQGAAMTIDWENTAHPYSGTKDIYVSKYSNNSTPYFIAPSLYSVTTDATLSFWIYLNGKFTNQMYIELFDASTSASSWLRITPYFNVNDSGKYQLVTVPISRFIWTNYSGNFDRMLFNLTGYDTSGTKGFYLDNIQFQKGINSIPPQTDYSNKLDSVLLSGDTLWQYSKGVKTIRGFASGSGTGNTKYVLQGYGTIIDSSDANHYTVSIDTTLLKDSLYAGRGIKVDTTTYPNHTLLVVDSNYVRDTSLHLVGGTTGQVLKKNSSTNGDWSWQDESGGTWGSITGTLSDQTDLQSALNAKQATLVSGTNIKTINGSSVLGSGDLTISGGSGGTDSASVHVGHITVVGDTAIVFTDLRGNSDTIAISLLQYWKKNGNKLYYNDGNVSLGTDTGSAKFTLRKDIVNETDLADSMGIMLSNLDTSSVVAKTSPPIIFRSYGNSSSTGFYDTRVRLRGKGVTGSSTLPFFYIEGSKDGGKTWTTMFTITNVAGLTVPGGVSMGSFTAAFGTMTSSLTVNGIIDNSTLSVAKQAVIGSGTYNDYSASLQMASTQQGFLAPRVTRVQRDSINLVISSVTVTSGGSYSGTPTLNTNTTPATLTNKVATLTAVKTGSAITSVTIADGGSYSQTPQIQIIGGTGSGGVLKANMTQVLTAGLQVFCTDCTATDSSTGVMQIWNGTAWKNLW